MMTSTRGVRRIGWFSQTRRVSVASMRYRCWHMAWALSRMGLESRVYTKAEELRRELADLDAVVIVKRLDTQAEAVAAAAARMGKPVFLDLCDDLLGVAYKSSQRDVLWTTFEGMAPNLRAITTPSPALAERLRCDTQTAVPIVVIPDMAETRTILRQVAAFAEAEAPASEPSAAREGLTARVMGWLRPLGARPGPKRVVWFGNHGAPHSNFGVLSLIPAAVALREAHARTPLELTVVSNHPAKFETIIAEFGVPVRYVSWTTEAVYDELERADVALLTNGDDRFSQVKSANRALQALACGTPVVATLSPSLEALGDAVVLDDVAGGLRRYLGGGGAGANAVRSGRRAIARGYAPKVVGRMWVDLLAGRLPPTSSPPAPVPSPGNEPRVVMFAIDSTDQLGQLSPLLSQTRDRGAAAIALITASLRGQARPVIDFLAAQDIIPTMASADDLSKGDTRWLRGADAIVAAGSLASASPDMCALAELAASCGVRTFWLGERETSTEASGEDRDAACCGSSSEIIAAALA
jgi:hypothetical protein